MAAEDLSPVARELRTAREHLKLTREALGQRAGYTADYIEKVENGRLPVTEPYVAAVGPVVFSALDAEFFTAMLERLRSDGRKQGAVPEWFRPWLHYEQEATSIRMFEPLLVPGLLQTADYARALLVDDDRVAARLDRQGVVGRVSFTVIVAEYVLRYRVGGPKVMVDQLAALVESPATVLVLPEDADTHLGTLGGFALATIDGATVAYADTPLRGFVDTAPEVVSAVGQRWEGLLAEALPRNLSQAAIMRAV